MTWLKSAACHLAAAWLAQPAALWSRLRETHILRHGRPLDPPLLDFARATGIGHPEEIRVEIVSRVPLPLPRPLARLARRLGLPLIEPAGMALGRGIAAISDDPALLRHELVHVLQYERLGGHSGFMRIYLYQCLFHGYFNAPLEEEARTLSHDFG